MGRREFLTPALGRDPGMGYHTGIAMGTLSINLVDNVGDRNSYSIFSGLIYPIPWLIEPVDFSLSSRLISVDRLIESKIAPTCQRCKNLTRPHTTFL